MEGKATCLSDLFDFNAGKHGVSGRPRVIRGGPLFLVAVYMRFEA
jgi:hypothetical protein